MKISFDIDGTLTDARIRTLCGSITNCERYIISARFKSEGGYREAYHLAEQLGISKDNVFLCEGNKLETIKKLLIDIHFDDDYWQCEEISNKTNCLAILVDMETAKIPLIEVKK